MKSVANILSASRIVLSFVLLPLKVFSIPFYILYAICALTDILDGFAARKTQSESEFGAKLDSISDTVFVAVCMIKLLTVIEIKIWLWIWIALIAAIKLVNIISGYVAEKKLVMLHTIANKIKVSCYSASCLSDTFNINISAIRLYGGDICGCTGRAHYKNGAK
jgi:CDP-diacylglycerol--glycerol-3-phosphate 3-phosphatidyltransferase